MNILTTVLSWLIFLALLIGSLLVWKQIFSILEDGEFLFVWLIFVCLFIWFSRRDKDGFYKLFKDIHQSNLDDIKEQQLEEQVDQAVVKKQIKTSLETAALFSIILFILMCGILFIFVPEMGLRDWLELLSIFPGILIFLFLIGKLVSTIEVMWKNKLDDTEEKDAEIIK